MQFRVHVDRCRQTIENFGASDCWSMQKIGAWSPASVERVADLLFSRERGIGLSCWRFNVGAGIDPEAIADPWRTVETFEVSPGTYDWTRQAGERRFLREALKRGVPQFLAFANSPPRSLTRNGHANCSPDGASTNLAPGSAGAFARYLADVAVHFRENPDEAERIPFGYISPINEPEWDWLPSKQEGCRASNADLKDIVRALGRELDGRGLGQIEIVAPESGSIPDMVRPNEGVSAKYGAPFGDYVRAFADDPEMAALLRNRLAYHSYWSDMPDRIRADREALRRAADSRPGLRLWQSEYCVMQGGRDLSMSTALHMARIVHLDLTLVNATAWQWWLAVSNVDYKDGLIYTDYREPGDEETVIESKLLWVLGNYSRYVRPGMVRVEVSAVPGKPGGALVSAYADPRTGGLTVVAVNPETDDMPCTFRGEHGDEAVPGIAWQPFVTSDRAGDDLRPYPRTDTDGAFVLPRRSVVTLTASLPGASA